MGSKWQEARAAQREPFESQVRVRVRVRVRLGLVAGGKSCPARTLRVTGNALLDSVAEEAGEADSLLAG
jgi:hypothetical protein